MSATLEREPSRPSLQGGARVSTEQAQKALQWALTSDKVPTPIKVSMLTSLWMLSVEEFHKQENETLLENKYESSLHEHRCVLSLLISKGEELVLSAKQNGLDPDAPFTIHDLEATVEALHIAFHAEHRNANSEEVNQAIAKLFPDEEQKD